MEAFRNFVKGWVGKVFLGLVIFVFVAFAFAPQFSPPGAQGEVAVVNDTRISARELDQAVDAMKARFGEQVDRRMLDQLVRRETVLETLIRQRVMIDAARELGLVAHPALVQESIAAIPAFQDADGKFSQERFQQMILANGFANAAAFRARVEEELLVEQMTGALRDSAFTTNPEIELIARMGDQKRDLAWVVLSPAAFIGAVDVSDAEVRARYDGNAAGYLSEEQFGVDYLELRADAYARDVRVDEAVVQARYDEMRNTARANAERRAAHILVSTATRDEAAARARADEVLKKLAGGASFAQLAAEYSDDTGSAQSGGDLGFIARGVFDPALESALSSLKTGDVSTPIRTPDGIHVLKLLEVREVAVPEYAAVRAELRQALEREEAMKRFQEALDEFGTLTYEAEGLQEPARKLGLPLQSSGLFGRAGGPGILSNPKVLAAIQSPEVLEDGRNSDPVTLEDGHVVVLHLREHRKPVRRAFEEVAATVRQELLRDKAAAMAHEKAKELKTAVAAGQSLESVAKPYGLTLQQLTAVRRNSRELPPDLLRTAFRAARPAAGAVTVDVVSLPGGSEAVFTVANVVDGNMLGVSAEERTALRMQLAAETGRVDFARAIEQATADADVERFLAAKKDDGFSVLDTMQELRQKYQQQRSGVTN